MRKVVAIDDFGHGLITRESASLDLGTLQQLPEPVPTAPDALVQSGGRWLFANRDGCR